MEKGKIVIFGIGGLIVIVFLFMLVGILPGIKKNLGSTNSVLTVWDFEDLPTVWTEISKAYSAQNPSIKIKYIQKNPTTFENEVINALASGTGPDIWAFKQSWILKHKNKIFPLPEIALRFTKSDFQRIFADVAHVFIIDKQIIALPTAIDTLALYYNKDIFNSENIPNPPQNWDELTEVVKKTTKISPSGKIIRSGIALGTAGNIDNVVDIISALFLQNELTVLDISKEESKSDIRSGNNFGGINALKFYNSFSNSIHKNYSWSAVLPNSIQAFADSKTAMIIGFSKDYEKIIKKNPRLNFGIAPLPQQKDQPIKFNYGIVSGLTVSKNSRNPLEAWRFIVYATTDSNAVKFYLNASNNPPAYRRYVTADFLAPYLEVFKAQILSARTWVQADERVVLMIFQNMIQSIQGSSYNFDGVLGATSKQLEELTNPYIIKPDDKESK
ncbi:MAG: extracellular solute-binding protein [Patescibacteria group bacterium]